MKRAYVTTFFTCACVLALFFLFSRLFHFNEAMSTVNVGFIYEGDESAPYTYNFSRAEVMLQEEYRDSVKIYTKNNVPDDDMEDTLRELAAKDCSIIFTNNHSDQFAAVAPLFPDIQICQISDLKSTPEQYPGNYHTFNARLYELRYVSGVAAGLKLKEMIDSGEISPQQAIVGYVGTFPVASVISGYTAFLIGIRSIVPEAVMKVKYTYTWAEYKEEKDCARDLIKAGCVVLSQHSDTIGPAVACEEASLEQPVVFVGCSKSLLDTAPTSALLSIRVNWSSYVLEAVSAVRNHKKIEDVVSGNKNGNDVSAGYAQGALEFLDLNKNLLQEDVGPILENAVRTVKEDPAAAYRGAYTGTDPNDPSDSINLEKGYIENANSSAPSFHYLLKDVIEVI
jgi:basic membrane protein A